MADIREEVSEVREREAWRLRLRGYTQQQIADDLGVTQQAICAALKRIERKLAEEFRAEAEEHKARQTEQLQMVFAAAWKQWERSCQDAEKETVVSGRAKATDLGGIIYLPDQVSRTVEGQSGNPALLAQAMKALADIRGVWGLDAPKQAEISGPGGGPVEVNVDDARSELDARLAAQAERQGADGSHSGDQSPGGGEATL